MLHETHFGGGFGRVRMFDRMPQGEATRYLSELSVVLTAYILCGVVGLAVPFTSGNVSPVWPAAGVALAAMLAIGRRVWPAVLIGAFLVNLFTPIPPVAALAIAVGNTAGPVAAALLLRRLNWFRPSLTRSRDLAALIVFGAFGGTAISATLGALTLSLVPGNPWSGFGAAWTIWYLGDATGVLTVTPLLLTAFARNAPTTARQILHFAALLSGAIFTSLLIFDSRLGFQPGEDLFAFAVFPFVIWAAVQFGVAGSSVVTLLISVVVVLETAYGSGPFAENDPFHSATLLQEFLAIISISGMTLAAVSGERLQNMSDIAAREREEAQRLAALEMEIAQQVQRRLLPQRAPALETLEYSAVTVQARAVGGDYYDYLDLGSNRVAFVLADISGKGICAALMMATLQGEIRSQAALLVGDLPQSLRFVNQLFYDSTDGCSFATLFVGIYDDVTRRLSYVNCGHNPPLLLHGESVERLGSTATILGMFEKWDCEMREIDLASGDILALYTDGIVEAANADGREFREAGLLVAIRENRHMDAREIVANVVADVEAFAGGEQGDDLTLILGIAR
jgi:serine phosphatase RsbU (regulator of sigma subunit)/integral membrane sensor domain MASE1